MRRLMAVIAVGMLWCVSAQAQEWPSGQVTIIVAVQCGLHARQPGTHPRRGPAGEVEAAGSSSRTGSAPAATPARRRLRRRLLTDRR